MSDDREAGVLFRRGDRVFWVPEERLGEFELDAIDAERVGGALAGEGEVSGFAARPVPGARTLSWGFEGSIGPKAGSGAWIEYLEYSPPPPPKGMRF
ncbi:MAG: hypothetical protein ACE367_10750 [Acidimicrobiales bacterium]